MSWIKDHSLSIALFILASSSYTASLFLARYLSVLTPHEEPWYLEWLAVVCVGLGSEMAALLVAVLAFKSLREKGSPESGDDN